MAGTYTVQPAPARGVVRAMQEVAGSLEEQRRADAVIDRLRDLDQHIDDLPPVAAPGAPLGCLDRS